MKESMESLIHHLKGFFPARQYPFNTRWAWFSGRFCTGYLIVDCSLLNQSPVRIHALISYQLWLMVYCILDDLNSLYVYKAKTSLFIHIAQTCQGAERLIEARVLPILADCDFLDTLPEVDQSFIGMRYMPRSPLHCYSLIWWLDHDHSPPPAIQQCQHYN